MSAVADQRSAAQLRRSWGTDGGELRCRQVQDEGAARHPGAAKAAVACAIWQSPSDRRGLHPSQALGGGAADGRAVGWKAGWAPSPSTVIPVAEVSVGVMAVGSLGGVDIGGVCALIRSMWPRA